MWGEFEDRFVWDFIPYSFLYSLFKEWYKRDNPSGGVIGRNTFIKDLRNIVCKSQIFTLTDPVDAKIRVGAKMNTTETLIAEFDLKDWQTQGVNSNSVTTVEALCRPRIPDRAAGIVRK